VTNNVDTFLEGGRANTVVANAIVGIVYWWKFT